MSCSFQQNKSSHWAARRLAAILLFCFLAESGAQVEPVATIQNDHFRVTLTSEEKKFIETHPEIILGSDFSFAPLIIQNQDGSISGYDAEIASLITQRTGLKFQFKLGVWEDIQVQAQKRELDGLSSAGFSEARLRDYNRSNSYLKLTTLVIVKKDNPKQITHSSDLSGKRVALQRGNSLFSRILNESAKNVTVVPYDSIEELLLAVAANEVDYTILDETVFYLAKKLGLSHSIEPAFSVGKPFDVMFWFRNDWSELQSIVNKGLESITERERLDIRNKWFASEKSIDYKLLWRITAIGLFIFTLISYWNRKLYQAKKRTELALFALKITQQELEQKNKELKQLSITDKLTQIYNRTQLDTILENEFARASYNQYRFGIIMVDVDYFKQVNDTYGHQVGDQILIELSQVLKTHIRATDTVGRWGGEEFLVICMDSDSDEVMKLATNLGTVIANHIFPIVEHKTASFGASVYRENDTLETLIRRVDEALYLAKNNGRNRVEIL